MAYTTDSEITRSVCERIGADPAVRFVETMQRGEKIFVRGTCGKPHEFAWLRDACAAAGYVYAGRRASHA